jgi:hypothetical protein
LERGQEKDPSLFKRLIGNVTSKSESEVNDSDKLSENENKQEKPGLFDRFLSNGDQKESLGKESDPESQARKEDSIGFFDRIMSSGSPKDTCEHDDGSGKANDLLEKPGFLDKLFGSGDDASNVVDKTGESGSIESLEASAERPPKASKEENNLNKDEKIDLPDKHGFFENLRASAEDIFGKNKEEGVSNSVDLNQDKERSTEKANEEEKPGFFGSILASAENSFGKNKDGTNATAEEANDGKLEKLGFFDNILANAELPFGKNRDATNETPVEEDGKVEKPSFFANLKASAENSFMKNKEGTDATPEEAKNGKVEQPGFFGSIMASAEHSFGKNKEVNDVTLHETRDGKVEKLGFFASLVASAEHSLRASKEENYDKQATPLEVFSGEHTKDENDLTREKNVEKVEKPDIWERLMGSGDHHPDRTNETEPIEVLDKEGEEKPAIFGHLMAHQDRSVTGDRDRHDSMPEIKPELDFSNCFADKTHALELKEIKKRDSEPTEPNPVNIDAKCSLEVKSDQVNEEVGGVESVPGEKASTKEKAAFFERLSLSGSPVFPAKNEKRNSIVEQPIDKFYHLLPEDDNLSEVDRDSFVEINLDDVVSDEKIGNKETNIFDHKLGVFDQWHSPKFQRAVDEEKNKKNALISDRGDKIEDKMPDDWIASCSSSRKSSSQETSNGQQNRNILIEDGMTDFFDCLNVEEMKSSDISAGEDRGVEKDDENLTLEEESSHLDKVESKDGESDADFIAQLMARESPFLQAKRRINEQKKERNKLDDEKAGTDGSLSTTEPLIEVSKVTPVLSSPPQSSNGKAILAVSPSVRSSIEKVDDVGKTGTPDFKNGHDRSRVGLVDVQLSLDVPRSVSLEAVSGTNSNEMLLRRSCSLDFSPRQSTLTPIESPKPPRVEMLRTGHDSPKRKLSDMITKHGTDTLISGLNQTSFMTYDGQPKLKRGDLFKGNMKDRGNGVSMKGVKYLGKGQSLPHNLDQEHRKGKKRWPIFGRKKEKSRSLVSLDDKSEYNDGDAKSLGAESRSRLSFWQKCKSFRHSKASKRDDLSDKGGYVGKIEIAHLEPEETKQNFDSGNQDKLATVGLEVMSVEADVTHSSNPCDVESAVEPNDTQGSVENSAAVAPEPKALAGERNIQDNDFEHCTYEGKLEILPLVNPRNKHPGKSKGANKIWQYFKKGSGKGKYVGTAETLPVEDVGYSREERRDSIKSNLYSDKCNDFDKIVPVETDFGHSIRDKVSEMDTVCEVRDKESVQSMNGWRSDSRGRRPSTGKIRRSSILKTEFLGWRMRTQQLSFTALMMMMIRQRRHDLGRKILSFFFLLLSF